MRGGIISTFGLERPGRMDPEWMHAQFSLSQQEPAIYILHELSQVFAEEVKDAWAELWSAAGIDRELDAIVLATGPLSGTNRHLVTLLDIAWAAPSAAGFQARVERQEFTS